MWLSSKSNPTPSPDFSKTLSNLELPPAPVSETFDENTICTIIYTSGTTGLPKGAMLTHKNLVSNAQAFSQVFTYQPSDRILCVLPMYHCFSWTAAILTPLLNGCSISILEHFSSREIEELLYAYPSVVEAAVIGVPDKLRGTAFMHIL